MSEGVGCFDGACWRVYCGSAWKAWASISEEMQYLLLPPAELFWVAVKTFKLSYQNWDAW